MTSPITVMFCLLIVWGIFAKMLPSFRFHDFGKY